MPNQHPSANGRREPQPITTGRREAINELFAMMTLRYPNSSWLKDDDLALHKRLWAEDLRAYSEDRIRQAIDMMPSVHKSFAPAVGEFLDLLKLTRANNAIEMAPICSNCNSLRISQRHADMCGGEHE